MLMYGWMKWVERAPERYDRSVALMTGGLIDRVKDRIAQQVKPGDRVLDIGCGTGTLALRCIGNGAQVVGLDSSHIMLRQARSNAQASSVSDRLELVCETATRVGAIFGEEEFDAIVSTLMLGEIGENFVPFVLADCHRLLRPGGRLIVADEVLPENALRRALYVAYMVFFWMPQFLILRRAFFPMRGLDRMIVEAGFEISGTEIWRGQSLLLVVARKSGTKCS